MKTITMYEANDGSIHATQTRAVERDVMIEQCEAIIEGLPPVPDSTSWSNGDLGYMQHDPALIVEIRQRLYEFVEPLLKDWIDLQINKHGLTKEQLLWVDPFWFSRLLDTSKYDPLHKICSRLSCINRDGREYGQPYFARNPKECKQEVYCDSK